MKAVVLRSPIMIISGMDSVRNYRKGADIVIGDNDDEE